MTLSFNTTKKAFVGLIVAMMCFTTLAPLASAQTYYYPTVSYQTQYKQTDIAALMAQLQMLIAQLQAMQGGGYTNWKPTYPSQPTYVTKPVYTSYNYDVEVTTEGSDVDGDDSATLEGDLELDDAPYAYVWFDYGTDSDLDEKSDVEKMTNNGSFEIEVDDLDEDDRYYFRAVAEDPAGYLTYGSIRAFGTDDNNDDDDDNNDDDIPEVTTEDADNVDEDSAELNGEVDMNDFEDGLAFFVYGEDEDAVEDAADEDTYSDIDQDGDDLKKVQVGSNVDQSQSFYANVYGLDDDTEHYYRFCVEYEDEDNDETLECGDVESFTTDEY